MFATNVMYEREGEREKVGTEGMLLFSDFVHQLDVMLYNLKTKI